MGLPGGGAVAIFYLISAKIVEQQKIIDNIDSRFFNFDFFFSSVTDAGEARFFTE